MSTPGGLESLGASDASNATFALIALAFLLLQGVLLAVTLFFYRKFGEPRWLPRRFFAGLLILFVIATVGERMVYTYSAATGITSITSLTQKIPYYCLLYTSRCV